MMATQTGSLPDWVEIDVKGNDTTSGEPVLLPDGSVVARWPYPRPWECFSCGREQPATYARWYPRTEPGIGAYCPHCAEGGLP